MIKNKFKLCILSAGKGTRNKTIAGLHKSLLPLENKSTISHIIRSVDPTVEIVIALGYKATQVESFIRTVFPERKIDFVYVENYDGKGSGPGLSLLSCKRHLQCPFIFTSSDTIVEETEKLSFPKENWIGASRVEPMQSNSYCLIKGKDALESLYYGDGENAFIGIAGIHEFKEFWNSLEEFKIINGEYQVIHGFAGLCETKLKFFTWHDTGNVLSYEKTRKVYNKEIVAPKEQEAIFLENKKVIKFFYSQTKLQNLVLRTQFLNNCIPQIEKINNNMISYDYVEGELLSNVFDEEVLKGVLDFHLDKIAYKRFEKSDLFLQDCNQMYKAKTYSRIRKFQNTDLDKIDKINGIKVLSVKETLDQVDWDSINETAIPSGFHGDFQPENIIYDGSGFKAIDWRESFGKSLEVGDLYYDLGKLHHALLINGKMVLNKNYKYSINNKEAFVEYYSKSNLTSLLDYFREFCQKKALSWENVELLGYLQFITISSLYDKFHDGEYGKFLFLLGKFLLTKHLNRRKNER